MGSMVSYIRAAALVSSFALCVVFSLPLCAVVSTMIRGGARQRRAAAAAAAAENHQESQLVSFLVPGIVGPLYIVFERRVCRCVLCIYTYHCCVSRRGFIVYYTYKLIL